MFYKVGCGCTVLVTKQEGENKRAWEGRLIDYCGGDGNGNPMIGPEHQLGALALGASLESMEPLTPEQLAELLTKLGELIRDGHKLRGLRVTLKDALGVFSDATKESQQY